MRIVRVYGSHVVVAFTQCLCLHLVNCSRRRKDLGGDRRPCLGLHRLLQPLLEGNYYKPLKLAESQVWSKWRKGSLVATFFQFESEIIHFRSYIHIRKRRDYDLPPSK